MMMSARGVIMKTQVMASCADRRQTAGIDGGRAQGRHRRVIIRQRHGQGCHRYRALFVAPAAKNVYLMG